MLSKKKEGGGEEGEGGSALNLSPFFLWRENRFRLAEPPELKGRRGVIHYTSLTRTFSCLCVCVCETRLFFPVQVPQGIGASLCAFRLVRVFSLALQTVFIIYFIF